MLSLLFGATPEDGPTIIKSLGVNDTDDAIQFDIERYKAEVLEGVREANERHAGSLQVQAIRIVPSDYPSPWQVKYVSYLIARHAITGENWG